MDMKNVLAMLAASLVAPAFAGASAADDPTLKSISEDVGEVATAVSSLADAVGKPNSASGCSATSPCGLRGRLENLAATVDQLAARVSNEVAFVLTVPTTPCGQSSPTLRIVCRTQTYLMGSTIPDFPKDTVANNGLFTDTTLPAGTYLVRLHQPYSDKLICNGSVSGNSQMVGTNRKRFVQCPQLRIGGDLLRLDDGSRVYTVGSAGWALRPEHRFPSDWVFGDGAPPHSFAGTIEITKLR